MSRTYNTEIISVGTELLLGHVTNTDARDVSEVLASIGINVLYHTVVGDNPERLRNCVEIAKQRADIIITTGGLGPTCDDLTKEILAQAFDLELRRSEEEYVHLYPVFVKDLCSLVNGRFHITGLYAFVQYLIRAQSEYPLYDIVDVIEMIVESVSVQTAAVRYVLDRDLVQRLSPKHVHQCLCQ